MDDNHRTTGSPDNPPRAGWTRVDNAVLPELAAIGGYAISVYVALKSYSDHAGECFPSLESVAKLSGVSRRTCIRCLAGMMQHGLITREVRNLGSGRASNLYRFTNSPSVTVALGGIAQVPKVTTPSAKSDGSPSATVALEQDPVINKNHKNKNQEARKPKTSWRAEDVELPPELDEAFRASWESWALHRRQIKKPLTGEQIRKQLATFCEWGTARSIAAIEHTVRQGWQGLREPEGSNGKPVIDQGAADTAEIFRRMDERKQKAKTDGQQ